MIYGIHRNITPPAGTAPAHRGQCRAQDSARAAQPYDQFQLSAHPTGDGRRVLETAARLSQAVRARPTAHELTALRDSVQSGAYQPDAREIAARMLLLGEV